MPCRLCVSGQLLQFIVSAVKGHFGAIPVFWFQASRYTGEAVVRPLWTHWAGAVNLAGPETSSGAALIGVITA